MSAGLLAHWPFPLPPPGSRRALSTLELLSTFLERGDIPSGFVTQCLVRSADEDTVYDSALVFCKRCLGVLRGPAENIPRDAFIAFMEEKKMPYFLNTLICLFFFFLKCPENILDSAQKCCDGPVFLKSLICQIANDRSVTHHTAS